MALGDAAGGSGLRARERQVHGGAFTRRDKFPAKEVARDVQATAVEGGLTLDTALRVASLDSEGLHLVEHRCHRVIWVLDRIDSLKTRLLVVPA